MPRLIQLTASSLNQQRDLPSPVLYYFDNNSMKTPLAIALAILSCTSLSCQKKDDPAPVSDTVTDVDGNTYKAVKIW